jgi:small-conductance mechanosensitive channel
MHTVLDSINDGALIKLLGSLVALLVLASARAVSVRALRRHVSAPELRRRWQVTLNNALFMLLVLALISIWAATIQTLLVSGIAVAVALVIATKELLMCLLGSIVRASGDSYSTGDRVEIGAHRGDVIHHNLLTTVLLELGSGTASQQHTGRTITLPNSLVLTVPVTKESSETPYCLHHFVLPVGRGGNLDENIQALLDAANAECAPFLDDVRRHWKRLASLHDVTESSPDPQVSVELSLADQFDLIVRVPAPTGRQAALQDAILQRFFNAHRPSEPRHPAQAP